jgi:phosphoglucosamine mutase
MTAMVLSGKSLNELKAGMRKFPQSMVNVPVECRLDLSQSAPVQRAIREVEDQLGAKGRVLLRPSGTEPVVRVMVEGEDAAEVALLAKDLATVVRGIVSPGIHALQ